MRYLIKFLFIFLLLGFLMIPVFVLAQDKASLPKIILFHGEECSHCQAERVFLNDLKKEFPDLEIEEYEVWHNEANQKIYKDKIEELGIKELGVPLTIVNDKYLLGFDKPENSGEKIKKMLGLEDVNLNSQETVDHPLFGKIEISKLSLPVLTVVLGTLDGFNPCSMWSLLVLLTLVIASGSRKKVFLVGGVFILVSAFSYFLFMTAWFNAFVLIGFKQITTNIIGIVALVAGLISIKGFYTYIPNTCEVSTPEQQQKITERIKNVLKKQSIPLLILGVAGIAFSVNLIEMFCSLGIPVVYTKALSLHSLTSWKYYAYILLYDFFYMLDDIIIVAIAGFTMKFLQFNTNYSKYSRLAAGLLMIALGFILLIKPEILFFG